MQGANTNPLLYPSIFAGIVALLTLILAFRYRRKDLYNQLLKEQITAAYSVINDLLEINFLFTEGYKKFIGEKVANDFLKGNSETDYETLQTLLLVELSSEYQKIYNKITAKCFIFPLKIQQKIEGYFLHINNLFEEENNEDMGINLINLSEYCNEISNDFNTHFKINSLSKQMKRFL